MPGGVFVIMIVSMLMPVSMGMVAVGMMDRFGDGESLGGNAFSDDGIYMEIDPVRQPEPADFRFPLIERKPEVEHGSEEHIATDA